MSQISLTFPDGIIRQYPAGVTPADVAASIAPSLAKASISAQVGGKHWDLQWPIPADATISLNTLKDEGPALELRGPSSARARSPVRLGCPSRGRRLGSPRSGG